LAPNFLKGHRQGYPADAVQKVVGNQVLDKRGITGVEELDETLWNFIPLFAVAMGLRKCPQETGDFIRW
jgi:hypothetical protein